MRNCYNCGCDVENIEPVKHKSLWFCNEDCRDSYGVFTSGIKPLMVKLKPVEPKGTLLTDFTPTRPRHYKYHDLDTFDFLRGGFAPEVFEGFLIGNVIKYVQRYPLKNGLEDLEKAREYLDQLIALNKRESQ